MSNIFDIFLTFSLVTLALFNSDENVVYYFCLKCCLPGGNNGFWQNFIVHGKKIGFRELDDGAEINANDCLCFK